MKPLIVANWKMNPASFSDAFKIVEKINLKFNNKQEIVLCPPNIFLRELKNNFKNIKFGSQNCFQKEKGAFTGETSPVMLKKSGCGYVIVGHSERRNIFNETDNEINEKIKTVLNLGMKVILCVGEKDKKTALNTIKKQLKEGLKDVPDNQKSRIIIAYEPVWAIGTGKSCDPFIAREIKNFIEKMIENNWKSKQKILYGGSVNSINAEKYLTESGFDGLLIGGASLTKDFLKIIKNLS